MKRSPALEVKDADVCSHGRPAIGRDRGNPRASGIAPTALPNALRGRALPAEVRTGGAEKARVWDRGCRVTPRTIVVASPRNRDRAKGNRFAVA
jgi:hypothetical protein